MTHQSIRARRATISIPMLLTAVLSLMHPAAVAHTVPQNVGQEFGPPGEGETAQIT